MDAMHSPPPPPPVSGPWWFKLAMPVAAGLVTAFTATYISWLIGDAMHGAKVYGRVLAVGAVTVMVAKSLMAIPGSGKRFVLTLWAVQSLLAAGCGYLLCSLIVGF